MPASPASPVGYGEHPFETMRTNSQGTWRALEIAAEHRATFHMASTSEVYGDPLEHPQTESYFGNVDPVGPRACYDEGKRFGEASSSPVADIRCRPSSGSAAVRPRQRECEARARRDRAFRGR